MTSEEDFLAVAGWEGLEKYGVEEGFDNMLAPGPEAQAAAAEFVTGLRATKIMDAVGGMTKEEFQSVLQKMMEMLP